VAWVGGEARTGRTEATNEGERTLCKGSAPREMCSGVKGRSKPVPEPADRVAGAKTYPLVVFFFFVIMRSLFLGTKSLMQR